MWSWEIQRWSWYAGSTPYAYSNCGELMTAPDRPESAATAAPHRDWVSAGVHASADMTAVSGVVILAALGVSAVALAVAPVLMSESYSWIANTTSESAAQGVSGAWLARLGFLLFGLTVIWLASLCVRYWGRWAAMSHVAFGLFMTAAAAFSARPWVAGAAFDPTEDALHSVAATAMGFAFAFGVAAQAMHRQRQGRRWRILDVIAVAAAVVVPLSMSAWPQFAGLYQRGIFVIAYLWYGVETVRCLLLGARQRGVADTSGAVRGP
jgi:Protein of unknown function (DUF998)